MLAACSSMNGGGGGRAREMRVCLRRINPNFGLEVARGTGI